MGFLDRFRPTTQRSVAHDPQIRDGVRALGEANAMLMERIAELELGLEDDGWRRLGGDTDLEFTRDGLDRIVRRSTLAYIKNPLIRRAVNVRTYYTFGQGVDIAATDAAVNEVVQTFVDDNADTLFSHDARTRRDVDKQVDGNVFYALFADRLGSGRVKVATIPAHEVRRIVRDPNNRSAPWFYCREWDEPVNPSDPDDQRRIHRRVMYPDHRHQPTMRPATIGVYEVRWDIPVFHTFVGARAGGFGIPDTYAALDWAKAHTEFLEDAATIFQVMARLLWKATAPGSKLEALRDTLGTSLGTDRWEDNPLPAPGSGIALPDGQDFQFINKAGAGVDAEDARQFALQVSAAMDVPHTILTGDVDQGNLATAQTLDRPTELAMSHRQEVWTGDYKTLFGFVVDQAATAPQGLLRSFNRGVRRDGNLLVVDTGDLDRDVTVDWAPLVQHSLPDMIDALVKTVTLDGKQWAAVLPIREYVGLVGNWLGLDDVDELVAEVEAAFEAEMARREEQEQAALAATAQGARAAVAEALREAAA